MSEANTIDLRGHEQACTRKEAEEYAAFNGYTMMFFGYSTEPEDVDPDCYRHDGFKTNRLLTQEVLNTLNGKMDCRDCRGSGLFWQLEDYPCNCTQKRYVRTLYVLVFSAWLWVLNSLEVFPWS